MPPEQKTVRKLRAILSADVKGYSLLIADDEAFTIKTLKEYRNIISSFIEKHSGRVVDSPGDNILAEFASAVEAVQCAVKIQKRLKKENERLVEGRRLNFRIGINIGDVVQDNERIYGDGVNVAARIEGLSDPGGVCLSRSAYDQIKKKLGFGFEYMGEHPVKNISEPVQIYKVLMESGSSETMFDERPKLPAKPSIAVLPFVNMSGDTSQEYFSDGITEEIITGLSKVPNLFVIARNSAFVYKGKPIKVEKVGKELGVRYVLEGSIRKADDLVRITAQLIDAKNGGHLWSERYDRKLTDIFQLQDDITKNIMVSLQIKLTLGEEARLYARDTDNLDAYMKFLHGRELCYNFNKEDNALGRQILEEVVAIDPNYASAYTVLSSSHFLDIILGTSKSTRESMMAAIKFCQKSIAMDKTSSTGHAWLGFLYSNIGKYDEAVALCDRAVELGPSNDGAYRNLARVLRYAGRWKEAIIASEKAIRFNPFPESSTLIGLALAYAFTGQFEKAIEAGQKAMARNPNDFLSHIMFVGICGMADRIEEAKAASANVRRIDPNASAEQFVKRLKWKRKEDIQHLLKALQKAGL